MEKEFSLNELTDRYGHTCSLSLYRIILPSEAFRNHFDDFQKEVKFKISEDELFFAPTYNDLYVFCTIKGYENLQFDPADQSIRNCVFFQDVPLEPNMPTLMRCDLFKMEQHQNVKAILLRIDNAAHINRKNFTAVMKRFIECVKQNFINYKSFKLEQNGQEVILLTDSSTFEFEKYNSQNQ